MTEPVSVVRTVDGRKLAYAEMGEPGGAPVFYFHSIPGSRSDLAHPFGQRALAGSGVRLIGIDRPGFGESEFQPGRTFGDWPGDVGTVADQLGIDSFGVLGYSAGAPYVVACALAMPARLTFAGIVSGVGAPETPRFREGMSKGDAIMIRLARLARPMARVAVAQGARLARRAPEKFSRRFDKELSPSDRELHRDPELRRAYREIFLESTRHGPAGIVEEYRIWGLGWDFQFEQIDIPVRIWAGDASKITPMHHPEYLARRLHHSELTVLHGVGHLHTPARWRAFLTTAAGLPPSETDQSAKPPNETGVRELSR